MSARGTLNIIKQRYDLDLTYHGSVTGLAHRQVWHGVWILDGVGEIARGTASSKAEAKEESSRLAVIWLISNGY